MLTSKTEQDNLVIFELEGNLNRYTLHLCEEEIQQEAKNPNTVNLVINFQKTDNIDSAALAFLVSLYQAMQEKEGRFVVCNLNSKLTQLFMVSCLDKIIPVYDDLQHLTAELRKFS